MIWASPLAWLLALGVVAPLAAHLLSRRPPAPYLFPTLRFVRATASSARRLRHLHDPWLLAVRAGIVLLIAGAAAGPTLVWGRADETRAPEQIAWVVGVGVDADDEQPPEGVWAYADAPVRDLVVAAAHDLSSLNGHQRTIVVRWSGDARELAPDDLAAVPAAIGLVLEPTGAASGGDTPGRLELVYGPADAAVVSALRELAPWHATAPATIVWPDAPMRRSLLADAEPAAGAIGEQLRRMALDPRLADAARRSSRDTRLADAERPSRDRFAPLARAADGDVLVWGAQVNGEALLVVDARPRDAVGLWTLRVAQDAWRSTHGWPRPSRVWTAEEVAAHTRPAAPPAVPHAPAGRDTRWWWIGAFVLLLVEQVMRRRTPRGTARDEASAETQVHDAA